MAPARHSPSFVSQLDKIQSNAKEMESDWEGENLCKINSLELVKAIEQTRQEGNIPKGSLNHHWTFWLDQQQQKRVLLKQDYERELKKGKSFGTFAVRISYSISLIRSRSWILGTK